MTSPRADFQMWVLNAYFQKVEQAISEKFNSDIEAHGEDNSKVNVSSIEHSHTVNAWLSTGTCRTKIFSFDG